MPCDSGMSSMSTDYEARRAADKATRIACDIMGALERMGVDPGKFSPETQQWWQQHKAADLRRQQAEGAERHRQQVRQSVIDRMTPEERAAMGIR